MGNGLSQIAPDDPGALELAEALRDEVEARQAETTAPRGRQRAATEIERTYVVPASSTSSSGAPANQGLNFSGWTRKNG